MISQVGLAQEDGKYHYEFIYSAIAQINEWQKESSSNITWLVSNSCWTNGDINTIQRIALEEIPHFQREVRGLSKFYLPLIVPNKKRKY